MARRRIQVDGETWEAVPAGTSTVYGKDQFAIMFQQGTGPDRRRRYTRFAPVGTRALDSALRELSDQRLLALFRESQPAWTAPEGAYGVR